jgi:hypothetical protein
MAYHLKTRMTAEEWDAVEDENPLAIQMRTACRKTELAIQGYGRAVYLSGGAGVGKSRAITEAIKTTGVNVIRLIPDDYRQVIFEECDHMFRSPRTLNLLKMATDTAGAQEMKVYVAPKKKSEEGYFKSLRLTAPTVFALNGVLTDDSQWPKECVPHIHALLDREAPIHINADPEAWWEYATFLALRRGMLRKTEDERHEIPLKIQNAAIRWFAENAWAQTNLSPRRLVKIAGVMMADLAARQRSERYGHKYDPRALEEDLSQFLKRGYIEDRPAPFAPEIFYTPKHRRDSAPLTR